MSVIARSALQDKLYEMILHDDTGDPHDEGYMSAVNELQTWLDGQPTTNAGAVEALREARSHLVVDGEPIWSTREAVKVIDRALATTGGQ